MMAEVIQGMAALERKMNQLQKQGSLKVARAAMAGMAKPLRGAIRRGVNGTQASTRMKSAVRKTIGSSVKKLRVGNGYTMKVGIGVGRSTKAKKIQASKRALGSLSGKGVGISQTNVHWAVLGTGAHSQKTRQERRRKTGASTGSTKDYFRNVVPRAIVAGTDPALKESALKARKVLQKEARKRR